MAFVLFLPLGIYGQNNTNTSTGQVLSSDLALLLGHWEGSLTYLDYSSNKPYTMPANLVVKQGKNEFQLKASHIYPNEPKANSNFKFKISKNGTKLNKRNVISREILPEGQIQIHTEYLHKDGNEKKMAIIRNTYTMGLDTFSIRKDVQFEGSTDWIMRNEYKYQKNLKLEE